jgi:hypothetical protein
MAQAGGGGADTAVVNRSLQLRGKPTVRAFLRNRLLQSGESDLVC